MKSRYLSLESPYTIVIREEDIDLENSDLICRTVYSAISPGTEISAFVGANPLHKNGKQFPRLLGYCNLSEIEEVINPNSSLVKGDKILTFQSHRDFFGIKLNEVILKIRDDVSDEDAVCSYLFHLGISALEGLEIKPDDNLLIMGMGCLGITSAIMAAGLGCKISVVSNYPETTKSLAGIKINNFYSRDEFHTKIEKNDLAFDASIITTNNWEDILLSMKCLKKYGRSGFLGFPGRDGSLPKYNPFDSTYFYAKQLTFKALGVLSPEREKSNMNYINNLFAENKINSKPIISSILKAENYEEAYMRLNNKEHNEVTFILDWK